MKPTSIVLMYERYRGADEQGVVVRELFFETDDGRRFSRRMDEEVVRFFRTPNSDKW